MYPTGAITDSPRVDYAINFTTPGTYTIWVRGYPTNAAGDSLHVGLIQSSNPPAFPLTTVTGFAPRSWNWASDAAPLIVSTPGPYTVWLRGYPTNAAGDSVYVGLAGQVITLTGFAPNSWGWASGSATFAVTSTGVATVNVRLREDGLRIDRLLLTTDTTYLPTGFGPAETPRQAAGVSGLLTIVDRTISYDYDNLYRLTLAAYSTGEDYGYSYDPVGNRLQQIINGDTTDYLYDAANRLASVDGQAYTFDNNGNLLTTGALTNTWDAANRLVSTQRATTTLQPLYNGVGDRVAQTIGATTTHFVLDVQGLPEVIYTSAGETYLHLPGMIMTENTSGETRYLLSDGLGSIRQAVDDTAQVVASYEFDPYGNPVNNNGGEPYGYTGEWYEGYIHLLHLRARWYLAETGTFLSRDPVESEPPYLYVRGNPVNRIDPGGLQSPNDPPSYCLSPQWPEDTRWKDDPVCQWWRSSSTPTPTSTPTISPDGMDPPDPNNSCQSCKPKSQLHNGYSESAVTSVSILRPLWVLEGTEVVFDFATLQIGEFEPTFESTPSSLQFDVGLLSIGKIYQVSYINGFEPEPGGDLRTEYNPAFVNLAAGVGGGMLFNGKIGFHWWQAEDGSLSGGGYWYGGDISILPFNLSFYKSSGLRRYVGDFGNVCNPEDARRFLEVLETWPYPYNYIGLYPGRLSAIYKFKQYAGID